MVIVNFNNNDIYATAYGAWQWDYGQFLRIQGLKLPTVVEIHFALQETGGTSETRLGTTKNGVTDVPIPDNILGVDTKNNYTAFAYIYITDSTSGQTEYKIRLPIKSRPKPEYMPNTPDSDLFRETIEMVNESADSAFASATLAESWAIGGTGIREGEDKNNAKYYANKANDKLAEVVGRVDVAKKHIDDYVAEKEATLKGDTGNVYFAAFRVVNGRLKMYSDPNVDKVRFVRVGSRLKYRLMM